MKTRTKTLALPPPDPHRRGWYGLPCWNGLSVEQRLELIERGTLEIGWRPDGPCYNPAEVEVTTMFDVAPGPRFYCLRCAAEYLTMYKLREAERA